MLIRKRTLSLIFLFTAFAFCSDDASYVEIFVDHFGDANKTHSETAGFTWKQQWNETINTTWEHSFDAVSGATRTLGKNVDGSSGATFGKPQYPSETPEIINSLEQMWYGINGASGATTDEIRVAEGVRLNYDNRGRVAGVGFNLSEERDYSSYSFNANVAWDFFDRNFTVGISHAQFFDDFHPLDAFTVKEEGKKRIANTSLDLTQVLTPTSLISGNLSYTYSWGYLGHPYTPVTTQAGTLLDENLPRTKSAMSLYSQWVQGYDLWDQLAVTRLNYRFYSDSWGLVAHTTEVQFSRYLSDWISTRIRCRYHWQSNSSYASTQFSEDDVYRTADIRLYHFNSILGGIQFAGLFPVEWESKNWLPDEWEIKWDHLWRDTQGDYKLYQIYSPDEYYSQNEFMASIKFLF